MTLDSCELFPPKKIQMQSKYRIFYKKYFWHFLCVGIIFAYYFFIDTNTSVNLTSSSQILASASFKEKKDSLPDSPAPANLPQANAMLEIISAERKEFLDQEKQRRDFDNDFAQAKYGDYDKALKIKMDIDFCLFNFSKFQPLEELQRSRCGFLKKTDIDTVLQLFQSIAANGNIKARLHLLENLAENSSNEIVSAKESGTQIALADYHKSVSADVIRNIENIAITGNSRAFDLLSQMYLSDNVVDYDYDKAMVYSLLAQHDWSKPGSEITAPDDLPANENDLARLLPKAIELFNSCCYGKEKSE
jgi:hypothetical protein